jgi:hypothetical protein
MTLHMVAVLIVIHLHKGIHHVFKPMLESVIKFKVFVSVKKKYHTATSKLKSRMALLQGEENDVTISNTSDELPTKEGPRIISKRRTVLLKGGEDIMTTISAPTTVAVNSINPIQIQFGTLYFGVKIEDDENKMIPVAPCQIKIEDQLAQREGSKLVQITEFTWEIQPTSPIHNSIRV